MGKILDLSNEQRKLEDDIFFLDEESENYQEEFDAIMTKQMANNKSLEHILEYLSDVLIEMKSVTNAKREVARSTQKRAITSENKLNNLKEFIRGVMISNNINKAEGKYGSLSLRKGCEVVLMPEDYDYSQLPDDLVTHVLESWVPNKNELKKYLKSGHEIEGIALLRSEKTLTIK